MSRLVIFLGVGLHALSLTAAIGGDVYFHRIGFPPGSGLAYATAITSDGSRLVGHAYLSGYHGFVWTHDSGFSWLADPPGSGFNVFVRGVSDDGRVVVGGRQGSRASAPIVWQDGAP